MNYGGVVSSILFVVLAFMVDSNASDTFCGESPIRIVQREMNVRGVTTEEIEAILERRDDLKTELDGYLKAYETCMKRMP